MALKRLDYSLYLVWKLGASCYENESLPNDSKATIPTY